MNRQAIVDAHNLELAALYDKFEIDSDKIYADARMTDDQRLTARKLLGHEFEEAQVLLKIEWGLHV